MSDSSAKNASQSLIHDELRAELKDAMRTRDQRRMDVIRQVESEAAVAKSAPGFSGALDDAFYLGVITAYCKKMDKARKEYEGLGERGREMLEKLTFEVEFLARWVPSKLGEEETRELVRATIAKLGVAGPKAVGRVMGQIMKERGPDLDGALVSRLVKEALGA